MVIQTSLTLHEEQEHYSALALSWLYRCLKNHLMMAWYLVFSKYFILYVAERAIKTNWISKQYIPIETMLGLLNDGEKITFIFSISRHLSHFFFYFDGVPRECLSDDVWIWGDPLCDAGVSVPGDGVCWSLMIGGGVYPAPRDHNQLHTSPSTRWDNSQFKLTLSHDWEYGLSDETHFFPFAGSL